MTSMPMTNSSLLYSRLKDRDHFDLEQVITAQIRLDRVARGSIMFVGKHLYPYLVDRISQLLFFEKDRHVSDIVGCAAGLLHEKAQVTKHCFSLFVWIRRKHASFGIFAADRRREDHIADDRAVRDRRPMLHSFDLNAFPFRHT